MRVLADGKLRFSILTTKPEDVGAPTAAELNEGYYASCAIFHNDFNFTAQAPGTADAKTLCRKGTAQAPTTRNHVAEFTGYRYWEPGETGQPAANDEDQLFTILQGFDVPVWAYARETSKDADDEWADDDEIYMGGEFATTVPQRGSGEDYIKRRYELLPQDVRDNIKVASEA